MTETAQIILRKEAKENGLKRYFTGVPCKRGHVAERATNSGRCVECNKIVCLEWQKNNRADRTAYSRRWYHRDVESRRLHVRQRRMANPEELRKHNEGNAVWRANNPGWVNDWRAKNPDKHKAIVHRRRARKNGAEGNHTSDDLNRIYKLQRGRCAYCREKLDGGYEVDHIIPLLNGGSNFPNNIQLLCDSGCNQRKGAKDPIDFSKSLGLLL